MIIGLFGDIRSGKTISAVKMLHELYRGGYVIYSNIALSFPYIPLTIDYLLNIVEEGSLPPENAVFFLDEVTLILDARGSGTSKVGKIISYFLLMSGKLGIGNEIGTYIIYTSQFPDLIDKRLWILSTIKISCQKQKWNNKTIIMQYWYIKKVLHTITSIEFIIADDYYHLYNTREIVKIPKSRYST